MGPPKVTVAPRGRNDLDPKADMIADEPAHFVYRQGVFYDHGSR